MTKRLRERYDFIAVGGGIGGATAYSNGLEVEPFFGADLGENRGLLPTSPHQAFRLTHEDMWSLGSGARGYSWDRTLPDERERQDALCMGTGLAAYFLRGAIDKKA